MEFNCSVRNYTNHGLEMFVGDNAKIFPRDEVNEEGQIFIQSLHHGELYITVEPAENCTATSCEGRGVFRMVVNSRTLPLMDFFWCRATHDGLHKDSNPAFIVNVLRPECTCVNIYQTSTSTNKPADDTPTGIPYNSDTTSAIDSEVNNGSQNLILNLPDFLLIFLCMLIYSY